MQTYAEVLAKARIRGARFRALRPTYMAEYFAKHPDYWEKYRERNTQQRIRKETTNANPAH